MKLHHFIAGLFAGMGIAASAMAVPSYTWNLNHSTDLPGPVTGTNNFNSSGSIVTAYGYATTNTDGSGKFLKQTITAWDGGLGIKTSGNSNENSSPNHAADNDGKDELFVFDFNNVNFMAKSFQIGWNNGTSGVNRPDLRVWIGGGATAINFADVCFTGCANTLDSLGFTSFLFADVGVNATQLINGDFTGRYLIIAADYTVADGQTCTTRRGVVTCTPVFKNDYFKLSKITGTEREPPPNQDVPEPASLGLIALGLLGVASSRKRRN